MPGRRREACVQAKDAGSRGADRCGVVEAGVAAGATLDALTSVRDVCAARTHTDTPSGGVTEWRDGTLGHARATGVWKPIKILCPRRRTCLSHPHSTACGQSGTVGRHLPGQEAGRSMSLIAARCLLRRHWLLAREWPERSRRGRPAGPAGPEADRGPDVGGRSGVSPEPTVRPIVDAGSGHRLLETRGPPHC